MDGHSTIIQEPSHYACSLQSNSLNRTSNWALNPNPWHSLSLAIFHQCHSDFLVTWTHVRKPPFISFLQNQAGFPFAPPASTAVSTLARTSVQIFLSKIVNLLQKRWSVLQTGEGENASGDHQNMLCPLLSKAQPPLTSYFRGIISPVPRGALLCKSGCPHDNRWMWMHTTGGTRSALANSC